MRCADPIAVAEKLAATIVAAMIMEAAYLGESIDASVISSALINDPSGETACYFRRSAQDVVALFRLLKDDSELLAMFPGSTGLVIANGAEP